MAPDQGLVPVLDGIVGRHGEAVLTDRPRLFALLRDYAPADIRAVRVLMTAYDSGALGRVRSTGSAQLAGALDEETSRLVDLFGLSPDAARAAVETWCVFVTRAKPPSRPRPMPLPLPGAAAVSATVDSLGRTAPGRWVMIVTGLVAVTSGLAARAAALVRRAPSR